MHTFSIIPKPVDLHSQVGCFEIKPDTSIIYDEPNQEHAAYLREFLALPMGYSLSVQRGVDFLDNTITLNIDPSLANLGEEGYSLSVEPAGILVKAPALRGIFYGIQTLRQLLPIEIEKREFVTAVDWQIPCCQIMDKPRFSWRGFMLDEGRHFQGKETVLKILDLMALQKLNTFHWHLTEDQGWRIEIKQYPKLTEIGSQRVGTALSWKDILNKTHNGISHGGFYTQDQIREIVAYAAQRNITIIPEIEIPGHCRAAVASYPELCCSSSKLEVATGPGIYKDIYCAGKETTFEFLENVLNEVLMLFPSKIIHIGGDEAPKARWKQCPNCQHRIQAESLEDEEGLQMYFIHRIANYLKSQGRQIMGWNEILGPGLDEEAIIQYWARGKKDLLQALERGQNVVNSAYLDTYLDHSYSLMPLSRIYQFDPIFNGLDQTAAQNICGLEAPLWTEWVPNRARLDYQVYPRLTAFAEVGWTPVRQKDYADFRERLTSFNQRLEILGVKYVTEKDWDPPWYRRLFGIFTVLQPQTRTQTHP